MNTYHELLFVLDVSMIERQFSVHGGSYACRPRPRMCVEIVSSGCPAVDRVR